ncbi:hypothetical protein [Actinomadura vinacea]
MIHDRDPVFAGVFTAGGLPIITTPPQTPRMNAGPRGPSTEASHPAAR